MVYHGIPVHTGVDVVTYSLCTGIHPHVHVHVGTGIKCIYLLLAQQVSQMSGVRFIHLYIRTHIHIHVHNQISPTP